MGEWIKKPTPHKLIDISNICMMLYYRMMKNEEKGLKEEKE